jgi:hypothetical protein
VAAKFDLFCQQRLACAALFGALVGKLQAAGARELGGGIQGGTAHGMTSLSAGFNTSLII